MSVWEWYLFGEEVQADGYTGIASKPGYPDVYQYTGDTITLRKMGNPLLIGGFQTSETKPGGGRVKGTISRAQAYAYVPGRRQSGNFMDGFNRIPLPFQRGEVLTGETDDTNISEESIMALLVEYGTPHRYPMSINEALAMLPKLPAKVHDVPCSVTSAAAITSGSGAVTLESASQDDFWIDADKTYYILSAAPDLIQNSGLLQFSKNLPKPCGLDLQCHLIPLHTAKDEVLFDSGKETFPYVPIGPFSMESQPSVGLFSIEAAATTFILRIAEM